MIKPSLKKVMVNWSYRRSCRGLYDRNHESVCGIEDACGCHGQLCFYGRELSTNEIYQLLENATIQHSKKVTPNKVNMILCFNLLLGNHQENMTNFRVLLKGDNKKQ